MTIVKQEYRRNSRSGSYERGLKFTTVIYEMLYDTNLCKYSLDQGDTWSYSQSSAWQSSTRSRRVKLKSDTQKEFAFDRIQDLNRRYHGPDYQWRP